MVINLLTTVTSEKGREPEATTGNTSAVRRLVGMQRGANFTIVSTILAKTLLSIMYVAAPLVIQPTFL